MLNESFWTSYFNCNSSVYFTSETDSPHDLTCLHLMELSLLGFVIIYHWRIGGGGAPGARPGPISFIFQVFLGKMYPTFLCWRPWNPGSPHCKSMCEGQLKSDLDLINSSATGDFKLVKWIPVYTIWRNRHGYNIVLHLSNICLRCWRPYGIHWQKQYQYFNGQSWNVEWWRSNRDLKDCSQSTIATAIYIDVDRFFGRRRQANIARFVDRSSLFLHYE